jgi:hypothetical protein
MNSCSRFPYGPWFGHFDWDTIAETVEVVFEGEGAELRGQGMRESRHFSITGSIDDAEIVRLRQQFDGDSALMVFMGHWDDAARTMRGRFRIVDGASHGTFTLRPTGRAKAGITPKPGRSPRLRKALSEVMRREGGVTDLIALGALSVAEAAGDSVTPEKLAFIARMGSEISAAFERAREMPFEDQQIGAIELAEALAPSLTPLECRRIAEDLVRLAHLDGEYIDARVTRAIIGFSSLLDIRDLAAFAVVYEELHGDEEGLEYRDVSNEELLARRPILSNS